jgi:hypothetical protein
MSRFSGHDFVQMTRLVSAGAGDGVSKGITAREEKVTKLSNYPARSLRFVINGEAERMRN